MFDTKMTMGLQTIFSGNPLDRADLLRPETDLLARHFADPTCKVMVWAKDKVLSQQSGSLVWKSPTDIEKVQAQTHVFLGLDAENKPHWAVDIHDDTVTEWEDETTRFRDLRGLAMKPGASTGELAMAAQAKSMLGWHDRHQFCAACGAPSDISKAGYERLCPNCGTHHHPRTDPVVIMLARCGDMALVGRGPQLPDGVFTALAGFMEPGERIEEAVARELEEEAGLETIGVQYVASQPWPWPSSLMIGCHAFVSGKNLTLDTTEVEDAFWISLQDAELALLDQHPDFTIPPPLAIARQLIERWVLSY